MSEQQTIGSSSVSATTSAWLNVFIDHKVPGFHLDLCCAFHAARTVVFGPSGSGKSSLLRAIAGLLEPEMGKIEIHGKILWERGRNHSTNVHRSLSIPAEKRGVGLVLQSPAIFPHLTVARNVGFALRETDKNLKRQRILELLHLVGGEMLADRRPQDLSGGQLQRVAIARTLAAEPSVLLLDEPFAALDARGRQEISENLYEWARQRRVPVMLVTHNLEEALSAGDEALVMEQGHVLAQGPPSVVLGEERERLLRVVGHGAPEPLSTTN